VSGDVSDRKRLISVRASNLRNAHLYISGNHDFFPQECYCASKKENGPGTEITLVVEGLAEPVKTDIAKDGSNGRPRNFFRNRRWVTQFFKRHDLCQGDNSIVHKAAHGLPPVLNDWC
jgi:hypothetical protein